MQSIIRGFMARRLNAARDILYVLATECLRDVYYERLAFGDVPGSSPIKTTAVACAELLLLLK